MKQIDYCCLKFKESVEESKFIYAYTPNKDMDETEWFMPEWLHIYYCPFCGTYIKGKGFGAPPMLLTSKTNSEENRQ